MEDLERKCYLIAEQFHKGQVDRGGNPYIDHPIAIAKKMTSIEGKCVALLHDILEDTSCSVKMLLDFGIPSYIVTSVEQLTRKSEETYKEYIQRVAKDKIAREIKIADLEHNMDLTRLHSVTAADIKRVEKRYKPAYDYLKQIQDSY